MKFSENDIEKFFKGKLTEKEAKEFLAWLHTKDGENVYNSRIEAIWKNQTERNLEKKEVDQHTANDIQITLQRDIAQKRRHTKFIYYKIAASLLVIFAIGYLFYLNIPNDTSEIQIAEISPKEVFKSVPKGQKSKITLPDGSLVYLNSESSIKFLDNFGENRTLHLNGEAFFEVAEDKNHPFEVITDKLITTALGTSFNIKAYGNSTKIEVSLASGIVKVAESLNNSQVEIKPGESIRYLPKKGELEIKKVDIQSVLNWKEGILQFEKIPLNEVIEILERWYGVDFEIKGSTPSPKIKCTGTFQPNEYLSNVLDVLGHSIEFNYVINGKNIILDFK